MAAGPWPSLAQEMPFSPLFFLLLTFRTLLNAIHTKGSQLPVKCLASGNVGGAPAGKVGGAN